MVPVFKVIPERTKQFCGGKDIVYGPRNLKMSEAVR